MSIVSVDKSLPGQPLFRPVHMRSLAHRHRHPIFTAAAPPSSIGPPPRSRSRPQPSARLAPSLPPSSLASSLPTLLISQDTQTSCSVCRSRLRSTHLSSSLLSLPTSSWPPPTRAPLKCSSTNRDDTYANNDEDIDDNDNNINNSNTNNLPPPPPSTPSTGEHEEWGFAAAAVGNLPSPASPPFLEDVILLDVNGMRCAGCVSRVREILETQEPVQAASVNLATETAVVRVLLPQTPLITTRDIEMGLSLTKKQEEPMVIELGNKGEEKYQAAVSTGKEEEEFSETKKLSLGVQLATLLTEKGYAATVRPSYATSGAAAKVVEAKRAQRIARLRELTNQLAIAWVLASACLVHHVLHWIGASVPSWVHWLGSTPVNAALSALALLGPGREIVAEGFSALGRGAPDMNSLVGLGATAAFSISAVAAALPRLGWRTFFEEPAMLLGVVLIGRTLEERAKLRASADMAALSGLLPPKARLLLSDKVSWKEVPSETVALGDEVVVLPGDRVPVDGVVCGGRSTIDESALTGEPLPVTKKQGDKVTAGTVNYDGRLTVEATASGGDTAVADVVRLVEAAQARAAPIQRFADVVAGKFTYAVMGAAAATFCFWATAGTRMFPHVLTPYLVTASSRGAASLLLSLQLACNVLVVACPCALGLAAPTAVLVGTGAGARRGLLIRGGDVLESASQVDTVIFDKTGTLTSGKPTVVHVELTGKHPNVNDVGGLLALAGAVEVASTHPIGKAIVNESIKILGRGGSNGNLGLTADEDSFTQEPGSGVVATVQGRRVSVGSLEWVVAQTEECARQQSAHSNGNGRGGGGVEEGKEGGIRQQYKLENEIKAVSSRPGHILVHVGIDSYVAGSIEIADEVRPDAAAVVTALLKAGISPIMLSGDQQSTAMAVALAVGIPKENVFAGVKPAGKAQVVEELQGRGRRVAMVGDGVNDAAALAQADVGIAMGGGVDAASEVADVVLLGDRIPQVLDVLHLSRATLKTIKQNMVWAFAYNAACIPMAAGALLPALGVGLTPSMSGALMGVSSLAVMANSLLLQLKARPPAIVVNGTDGSGRSGSSSSSRGNGRKRDDGGSVEMPPPPPAVAS